MSKRTSPVLLGLACLALAGCAHEGPAMPQVSVLPGKGKSYEAFQREDAYCQAVARDSIGNQSPGAAANEEAVKSAAVGTALGALGGAAIGSLSGNMGAGAAIGAGTGLAAGGVVGANRANAAGGTLQQRYDTTYVQCMTAKGNVLPRPVVVAPAAPVVIYDDPPPPPPPYYPPPR